MASKTSHLSRGFSVCVQRFAIGEGCERFVYERGDRVESGDPLLESHGSYFVPADTPEHLWPCEVVERLHGPQPEPGAARSEAAVERWAAIDREARAAHMHVDVECLLEV